MTPPDTVAWHELEYVTPSQPQTGSHCSVHIMLGSMRVESMQFPELVTGVVTQFGSSFLHEIADRQMRATKSVDEIGFIIYK